MISIIIVNYKSKELIKNCLASINSYKNNLNFEFIIVDNSQDIKADDFQSIELISNNNNLGFATAVNQGIKKAQGDYILLVNPDITLKDNVFEKMLNVFKSDETVGIVGANLVYPSGQKQACQGKFPSWFTRFLTASKLYKIFNYGIYYKPRYKELAQVDWVSGGFMMIKKEVISKVGLFDHNFFLFLEDIDFCYRAKQSSFKVMFLPTAEVEHIQGATYDSNRKSWQYAKASFKYYYQKHKLKIF